MPMERPPNPTPINPYAKYLSNSISNVLYCIKKFDQGTLAWPTGPRKRNVWTKQMSGSPSGVPLAGTGSSVIPNSRQSRSKPNEGVDKKNAFYQILQASQDQPSCGKSAGRSRIETKREFNLYNDGIYNDIVKTHLQCKCHPKSEYNQPRRPVTPKVPPPVIEIYTVRPRDTETTTQQKPSKFKHSRKELFQIWPQINKRREQPKKDIDKAQTTLPETNISKETTEHQHYSHTARIPILKHNSKLQNYPPKAKETTQRQQKPPAEQLPILDSNSKVFSKKPKLNPPTFIPEFPSEENHRKLTRKREKDIQQKNVKEDRIPTGLERKIKGKETTQSQQKPPAEQDPIRESSAKVFSPKTPIVEHIVNKFNETRKKQRNSTGNSHERRVEENSAGRHKEHGTAKVKSNPIGKSPLKEVFRNPERLNEKEPDKALTKLKPPTFIPEFPSEADYKKLTRQREEDIQQKLPSEELSLRHSTLNPIGNSIFKELFPILERPNEKKPEQALIKPKPPKFIFKFPTLANYKKPTQKREEDVPQNNVKEDTIRKPTGLKREIKAEPASATKIRKLRIFKAESTKKYSKASRHRFQSPKVDQKPSEAAFTPAIENSFIATELRNVFELPSEIVNFWSTRPSLDRRRLRESEASRKSTASTDTYQEKLRKLKHYLNKPSGDNTENTSLDLEGIHDRDLLLYPYNDFFKMDTMTEVKDTGIKNKQNKPKAKQKPPERKVRSPKMEKECQEVLKKKSACCICRTIRCPGKDAPFLEEMKKAQRRQELLAYRANMAMWNKSSKGSNRVRELDKIMYSLEDRYIVFTRERKLNTCPKKSNSTIFPTPSKRITFLKRCNSFIFPKESSSITCS